MADEDSSTHPNRDPIHPDKESGIMELWFSRENRFENFGKGIPLTLLPCNLRVLGDRSGEIERAYGLVIRAGGSRFFIISREDGPGLISCNANSEPRPAFLQAFPVVEIYFKK
jgi:hypothetical protein